MSRELSSGIPSWVFGRTKCCVRWFLNGFVLPREHIWLARIGLRAIAGRIFQNDPVTGDFLEIDVNPIALAHRVTSSFPSSRSAVSRSILIASARCTFETY